jgi:hypothetical protein
MHTPSPRVLRTLVLATCALALAACGGDGGSRWGDAWPTAEERRMKPEDAPSPFTAAQIRAGCEDGRTSTFRLEVPGAPTRLQTFRFTGGDDEGCTFEISMSAADGRSLGRSRSSRGRWTGFQSHASYPQARTTIGRETLVVPGGRFHCMRYVVTGPPDAADTVTTSWFARELPGPPVLQERRRGGTLLHRMVLVRTAVEPPAGAD